MERIVSCKLTVIRQGYKESEAYRHPLTTKPAKAARCVRVRWQADGQTHSETGILITSTSSYALLMKPNIGNGVRVPLSGHAILEAVNQLESNFSEMQRTEK